MEMKENLVPESQTTVGQSKESTYFIKRYNDVIEAYNQGSASTAGQYLQIMDINPFFMRINQMLSKKLVQIVLVVVLATLPIVNLFCMGFLWFYYFHLHKQAKIHHKNMKKCRDPLHSFYFLPQVCKQLDRHCTQMTIKTKDVEGFTFNPDLYNTLKAKHAGADEITVTIYDQYFYDSFHLFKKQKYKVGAWILLSILLVTANVLILASVLHWI